MIVFGGLVFVAFGVAGLGVAVAHEWSWWKRRDWVLGEGRIVGSREDLSNGRSYFPEIEYAWMGESRVCVSSYGSSARPKLNKLVEVTISPDGRVAEIYTPSNRLLATVFPVILGGVFIVAGVSIAIYGTD